MMKIKWKEMNETKKEDGRENGVHGGKYERKE